MVHGRPADLQLSGNLSRIGTFIPECHYLVGLPPCSGSTTLVLALDYSDSLRNPFFLGAFCLF